MPQYAMPISSLMTTPVVTISDTAALAEANELMLSRGLSSIVATTGGRAAGVVTRTDLLRIGRVEARTKGRPALLTFPDAPVSSVMQREIVALPATAPVSDAARVMVDRRIHRVFVMNGDEAAGVFSTKEVYLAVRDARAREPIADYMSAPVVTLPLTSPLSVAVDRLHEARISGLCVVDEHGWPVGTFTQQEALAARDLPPETPLEEVMSYAMLCLELGTPLYRAAAYAHATGARRVLAVENRRVRGVLTGLDFARAAGA